MVFFRASVWEKDRVIIWYCLKIIFRNPRLAQQIVWEHFTPTYNLGALSPKHGGLLTFDVVQTLNSACLLETANNSQESHLCSHLILILIFLMLHNTIVIALVSFISFIYFCLLLLYFTYLKREGNICGLFFLILIYRPP